MDLQEKILTLHPQGKKGVNISLQKYLCLKKYIVESLQEKSNITFKELCDSAKKDLQPTFDGDVLWYLVSVKLDLEARKMITRKPGKGSHQLVLLSY